MKSHLLARAVTIAALDLTNAPPIEPPAKEPKPKPVAMIGTMRRDATPEQRKAFAKMKRDMKRAARSVRYDQHLQEREARDKP